MRLRRSRLLLAFVLGAPALLVAAACGAGHHAGDDDGSGAGARASGAAGAGGSMLSAGSAGTAGGFEKAGQGAGGNAGRAAAGASGGEGHADGGASGGDAGAPNGGDGPSGTDGGASGGEANGGSGGIPTLGTRCTDCTPLCWDQKLELPQPQETCTEPSPVTGLGIRFDLVATLPSGEKRYLADSPYDYSTDAWPSWSSDSLGQQAYHVDLPCGSVWLGGTLAAGTAEPGSATYVVVSIDGVQYSTKNPDASVVVTPNQAVGATDDDDLGPLFDLHTTGTLTAADGSQLTLDGDMRNVPVVATARSLGRLTAHAEGMYQSTPNVFVVGQSVLRGPIYTTSYSFDVLTRDLATPTSVPLAESVGGYIPLPDGSLLSASQTGYGILFDATGGVKWRSAAFTSPGLQTTGAGLFARADGSACFVLGGSNAPGTAMPDPTQPSQLICVDAAGAPKWQASLYPITSPASPTELADGTLVVNDGRTPNVVGIAPDGTRRFAFNACTPDPTNQFPYFKTHGVTRNADGSALAQLGDEVVSFDADGHLRWRSVAPLGDAEILVAEDGTLRVLADGYLLKLGTDGSLVWMRAVGTIGDLVGVNKDGTTYVTGYGWSNYGMLSAVRADSSIAWSAQTTIGGWTLAPEGDLYGFSKDVVEHIHGDSPLAQSSWPSPRGGPLRDGSL